MTTTTTTAIEKRSEVPTYIIEATEHYGAANMRLLRDTICRDLTLEEMGVFLHVARAKRLDALARQIYAVKRYDKRLGREVMTIQTGIDGFRVVAERTGKYRGQVGPYWCGDDGVWRDVWLASVPPSAARVGVLRADFAEPLWGVALWREYAQTKDGHLIGLWRSHPSVMLAKCAEVIALRRSFPEDLSGLYSPDEMPHADVDATTEKRPHSYRAQPMLDVAREPVPAVRVVVDEAQGGHDYDDVPPANAADEPPPVEEPRTEEAPAKSQRKSATGAALVARATIDKAATVEDVQDALAVWKRENEQTPKRLRAAVEAYAAVRIGSLSDEPASEEVKELAAGLRKMTSTTKENT